MDGKYRAYSKYKDSGVDWIGKIPNNWSVSKLGYHITTIVPMRDKPKSLLGEVPWIRIEDFDGKYISESRSGQGVTKALIKEMNLKIFPIGTVLCTCSCIMGTTAIVSKPLISNQTFIGLVPKKNLHSEYLYYLMQASQAELTSKSAGAIQQYLSQDEFKALRFGFPSFEEQQQIANFLDYETAKIDTLIKKQQQLITLLKEKRQAVISHAVTKGLNPDVPMRDSGVEWLGQVPAHWEVKRVKHFGKIIGGYAFKSGDFVDSGIRAIKIANVSHLTFHWSDSSYLPKSFIDDHKIYIPPKNSLVFAMTRPIISGGVKVAKFDLNEVCLVNQRVGFLKPSPEINQDYLMYVAQSKSFYCAFENNCTVTNQPNISAEGIEDIRFACPELTEQQEVVTHIKQVSTLIEDTISKGAYQIDRLQERRTALISAAVTGKIDVRQPT